MKYIKSYSQLLIMLIICNTAFAQNDQDLTQVFPLNHYSQNVDDWIRPTDNNYNSPLTTTIYQQEQLKKFYQHYYSSADNDLSPWSKNFVLATINGINGNDSNNIVGQEIDILNDFYKKIGIVFGLNYRPYSSPWFDNIANNMNLLELNLEYNPKQRAIAVNNTLLRILPTNDPLFYSSKIAGQGYPFDQLQETAVYIGTPLYILNVSKDQSKYLVITPDAIGWIDANSVGYTSNKFIDTWQHYAQNNGIIAITAKTTIRHNMIYNGTTLPLISTTNDSTFKIAVPILDKDFNAQLVVTTVNNNSAVKMPLKLTPHNLATMIKNQIGEQYGWGSYLFKYDCSAELKALFTPFGIYLPRNSQYQWTAGNKVINLDNNTALEREQYLLDNGKKLLTLVQIPGHIFLYIGKYTNLTPDPKAIVAISYQNIWGLRDPDNTYRSIIGGSSIIPLLHSYPEDKNLISFYNDQRKIFRLIFLG